MNRPFDILTLTLNGESVSLPAHPGTRLSELLREGLGLRGTKVGCDAGDCGAMAAGHEFNPDLFDHGRNGQ